MKTLYCQLGLHTIILPEAFLLAPEEFSKVCAIGTDNATSDYSLIRTFFEASYPDTQLDIAITVGLERVGSSKDHYYYEEVLWRWYVQHLPTDGSLPYVCLSGGTKSMVASLQKATHLFGAEEVFHVQVENIRTLEELDKKKAAIDYITLGYEEGWPVISKLVRGTFQLAVARQADGISLLSLPDDLGLRATVHSIIAKFRDKENKPLGELPFASVNLLPKETISWLQQPLAWNDIGWLEKLPKAELHCHLGGFATFGNLLDSVRNADNDTSEWPHTIKRPEGWPFVGKTVALDEYMRLGDNTGSTLFKNPKRLKKQIELLYAHFVAENVAYAEIRCSPNNYASGNRSAWEVLEDIQSTFQHLMDSDGRCHVNLIIIATRKSDGDFSPISKHLALAITASQRILPEGKCRVVGVDLAGFENEKTRASYYSQDFAGVLRCGLAITVHAGENDSAEGIWQAVHSLHARRLGHALNLYQAPDLLQTVADRRIAVEMCPYANYQIKGFYPMKKEGDSFCPTYPLYSYLKKGVMVTVNTDNIGISDATLSQNFQLLAKMSPEVTRLHVLQLIKNSLEVAFISPILRKKLLDDFDRKIFHVCNTYFYENTTS
jgi:adenosine deaminase